MICVKRRTRRKMTLRWATRGLDWTPDGSKGSGFVYHLNWKHLDLSDRTPAIQFTTARFEEWWQFRSTAWFTDFLSAWCVWEHLKELRLTSVMHSLEPKPLACLSGIIICSENGCRQRLWEKEGAIMVKLVMFLLAFSCHILHQPSRFNGDGTVYLTFFSREGLVKTATALLKCWV